MLLIFVVSLRSRVYSLFPLAIGIPLSSSS